MRHTFTNIMLDAVEIQMLLNPLPESVYSHADRGFIAKTTIPWATGKDYPNVNEIDAVLDKIRDKQLSQFGPTNDAYTRRILMCFRRLYNIRHELTDGIINALQNTVLFCLESDNENFIELITLADDVEDSLTVGNMTPDERIETMNIIKEAIRAEMPESGENKDSFDAIINGLTRAIKMQQLLA